MTSTQFAVIPEEAFRDDHMTLGALRLLRVVWSICLREGRVIWSPFLTASELGKVAGMRPNNLSKALRELADREYIIVGPKVIKGLYCLRPHQRFGEKGPSIQELEKSFRQTSVDGRNAHSSAKTLPSNIHRCFTTTDSESIHYEDESSSSSSLTRKPLRQTSTDARRNSLPCTPTQQAILDLLADNGMAGAVPTQVALTEGMTFRRVALLVADGVARNQKTGMVLTRLKGADIPPRACPLCGGKSEHRGFTDGDVETNCPLADEPDMADEQLAAAWRRIRGMKIQVYWMGQGIEE